MSKNKESNYTPGPWKIEIREETDQSKVDWNRTTQEWEGPKVLKHIEITADNLCQFSRSHMIAKIFSGIGTYDGTGEGQYCDHDLPTKANAHLIAASPDMLEALENLENDNGAIPEFVWEMVQDAIAKAKGGTE